MFILPVNVQHMAADFKCIRLCVTWCIIVIFVIVGSLYLSEACR